MSKLLQHIQTIQLYSCLKIYGFYYIKNLKIYLTRNPKWLFMYIFGRFQIVRSIMVFFSKYRAANNYQEKNSLYDNINVNDVVESLKKDSLYLGINLPPSILNEILDFAKHANCYGDGNLQYGFSYSEKELAQKKYGKVFRLGRYFNSSLLCPAIQKLESDPKLLQIAAKYLEAEPLHTGTRLWWSFAGQAKAYEKTRFAQVFHYDLDDYRCLKFFFYLTDVDLSDGPHVCILKSHNKKKLTHILSLSKVHSDKNIIDYYGAESEVTICGKAGFGFAEDPFCFHKGKPPTSRDRLILEIQFSINNYGVSGDIVDPLSLKTKK